MSTSTVIVIIVLLVVLLMLSAFFSAAETAYSSVSKTIIKRNLKKGKKSAMMIDKHHKSFGWVLSTILISNNLVNVLSASVVTYLLASFVSSGNATIISTAVMTPLIVVFGEIIPKLLAKKYSYGYLVKIVYVMELLNWLFLPFTFLIKKLTLQTKVTNTESDLKLFIDIASEEGVLEKREATLANNALDLDSTPLKGMYIPIKDVIFAKHNDSRETILKLFKKSGHSRLPIKKHGKLIGSLVLKDLIFSEKEVSELIIETPRMNANVMATKALEQMRINSTHMVFIVSSTKKIIGLLTLEDIIEELIGEIYDEHDATIAIKQISLHKYYAYKNATINELEKILSIKFDKSKKDQTIKQWMSGQITRNFAKGLSYTYKKTITFKVLENSNKTGSIIEIIQK